MEPQDELQLLLDRQEALNQELKAKKKELQDAQRRQRANLQKQIRRAQGQGQRRRTQAPPPPADPHGLATWSMSPRRTRSAKPVS